MRETIHRYRLFLIVAAVSLLIGCAVALRPLVAFGTDFVMWALAPDCVDAGLGPHTTAICADNHVGIPKGPFIAPRLDFDWTQLVTVSVLSYVAVTALVLSVRALSEPSNRPSVQSAGERGSVADVDEHPERTMPPPAAVRHVKSVTPAWGQVVLGVVMMALAGAIMVGTASSGGGTMIVPYGLAGVGFIVAARGFLQSGPRR